MIRLTPEERLEIYKAAYIEKSKEEYTLGLCLMLRDLYSDIHGGYFNFSDTPKKFREYGLINPYCQTHENDAERLTALALCIAMLEK